MANTDLTEAQTKALELVSKGTLGFAFDFYDVMKSEPGNLFFSPLSLQLVLALAYTGAKSTTAKEIAKALYLPEKLEDVLEGYNFLLHLLEDPSLSVANKMFIEEKFELLAKFQTSADNYFKAKADPVPFEKNSEGARKTINSWVESKTNNKIKDLLAPGVINGGTRMVLVNAIHFKADWSIQFEKRNTKIKPFYVSKNETVKTNMMHMTKQLDYLYDKELKFRALKLSYAESDLEMLILLPDAIDGLAELESKLSSINFSEKFRNFSRIKVEVQLPKFKLETSMQLNDVLKKMGLKAMFSEQEADFSGITSQTDLVVSDVIQKAFVEVNEKGTEAAAATAMVMALTSCNPRTAPKIEKFIADHPFLHMICSKHSPGTPIFFGRYSIP